MDISQQVISLIDSGHESYLAEDYSSSLNYLFEALRLRPGSPDIYFRIGRVYSETGELNKAKEALSKSLSLGSDNPVCAETYARILENTGDTNAAVTNYERALKMGGDSESLHLGYGFLLYSKGDIRGAEKEYISAVDKAPESTVSRVRLAELYAQQDKFKEAETEYLKAVELSPSDPAIREKLAALYLSGGDYDKAASEYEKIPGTAAALDTLRSHALSCQFSRNLDDCVDKSIEYTDMERVQWDNSLESLKRRLESFSPAQFPNLKVKVIRMPAILHEHEGELNYSLLMPLGVGRITSFLRKHGIYTDQDDLDIRIHTEDMNPYSEKTFNKELFFDKERIMLYSRGNNDAVVEKEMERIESICKLRGYNLFLFSVPESMENSSSIMFLIAFSRYLKRKYAPVIAVGGFDLGNYDLIKENCSDLDYIVEGAGETISYKIALSVKYAKSLGDIDPAYRDCGSFIKAGADLWYVQPDYTGLPLEMYKYKNFRSAEEADEEIREIIEEFNNSGVMISKFKIMDQCHFNCIFCGYSEDKLLNVLNLKEAVSSMKEITDEYGATGFFLLDNTLNITPKFTEDFCDEIKRQKLKTLWTDCARGDNLNKDTLTRMRDAGCLRLVYGMEVGNPRLMKYINKGLSLKKLEKVLRWSSDAGIWTGIEVINGFPYEKKEDLEELVSYVKSNWDSIDQVYLNILNIKESSQMNMNPKKYGIERVFPAKIEYGQYGLCNELSFLRLGFDEIGGLKWKDKLREMVDGYKYLKKELSPLPEFPPYENEHFLFYLYSKYSDKKKIKSVYDRARLFIHKQNTA